MHFAGKMDLRKSLFILPNLFTLSSLFCGLYAIALCIAPVDAQQIGRASVVIVFAMLFDMFDGRVARLTKTQSLFGLQFDSLADMVSFGVAPAVLIYRWSLSGAGVLGLVTCFLYAACGAIRLSRFNVLSLRAQERQPNAPSPYILGLPIPTAAGFVVAVVIASKAIDDSFQEAEHVVMIMMTGLALLMVSNVRFRSFKNLRPTPFNIGVITIAVGSSLLLWIRFKWAFILIWLVAFYITIGILENLFLLSRRLRKDPRTGGHAGPDDPKDVVP